ncbi:MAG: 30S ribosomal protein S12 methylthiotransferase RimO [Vicinamibacteria bacterium]|nr:30S ribosomal protein S12 methylthiotransferase RimO [Vicinamibacteria bacterium]
MIAPRRVGFVSLGCPKNLVDSEVMLGSLKRRGHEIATDPGSADVIVVNTCAFIDRAKKESIDTILEMAKLKTEAGDGSPRRLIVTGCLAERHDADLRREIPEIDATLGTGQIPEIVAAVEGRATMVDRTTKRPEWIYDADSPRLQSTASHTAFVKISEGCDYTCTFCIIPTLRGLHRSRRPEDIENEVRRLAAAGVREVVLVAQDSTRYGLDLGERGALAPLLRRLGRIEGVRWIRVMYAYPATVTDEILDAIATEERVVKYVDMPLQHASDAVLKRMKRPTGKGNLLGMVERVRDRVPGVAFRTTFIVGFPGETEDDFRQLTTFVEQAEFDHLGVFTYSDEDGTAAFALEGRVPTRVKKARQRELMRIQKRISLRRNKTRVGSRMEVLVEGPHPETDLLLSGRLASQAPEIDGSVLISDPGERPPGRGEFVTCEVTKAHSYDLEVRVV